MMLTTLWLLPAVGGTVAAFMPHRFSKWLATLIATVILCLTLIIALDFTSAPGGFRFVEQIAWVPQFNIYYHLGIDGLSVWLLVLNALIGLISVLAIPKTTPRCNRFVGLLLLMIAGMMGVFLALDLIVFYVFWEAMLIPAYFLLWIWGEGKNPLAAALKFVIYTLVGSLLMLAGIIGEYVVSGSKSFDITYLANHPPAPGIQFWLFFVFALAFAIKIPIFPFHTWLPKAYMAAPTPMLLLFAGVMGKTGAYAFLRIGLPLFPQPIDWWNWNAILPILAVAGIAWGGFLALIQKDVKALISYSSISHMGFIVLGIFTFNTQGQQGAVMQMLNHGIIVPALFLISAWIASRVGSQDRSVLSGLAPRMPIVAGVFLVVTLAALGLPGLNSFVGEFMILWGAWQFSPILAVLACSGLILAPIYMLRLFQGIMHSDDANSHSHSSSQKSWDLTWMEGGLIAPLLALMFLLGLFPSIILNVIPQILGGSK